MKACQVRPACAEADPRTVVFRGCFVPDTYYICYNEKIAGATLCGNLAPVGASANIAGLGILRKDGYEVKPLEFMKISGPFTLVAVLSGYVLVWLIWS